MTKILATVKAIITRLVFACHGIIAIWQVTIFKGDPRYWYLALPTLLLFLEGVFTLTIKDNQEWKWFCPSVFIYLGNVVPAIWLLELHKVDKRLQPREEQQNVTTGFKDISAMLGGRIHLPEISVSMDNWVTLIEQFLMLTLIVGRWLLPKGDLTRDQLSQLLLVYIGTAADIIEFFDSFKDETIVKKPLLVLLTLGIWSWSLLQFTVVLTATKSRKSRVSANGSLSKTVTMETCCCSIDVCAIMMNIALQDAPFLAFRLLIIIHYDIISYMNVFFTCKNTLVILLQMYRLYVVHSETRKNVKAKKHESKYTVRSRDHRDGRRAKRRQKSKVADFERDDYEIGNIAIISNPDDIHKMNNNKDVKIRAIIMKDKNIMKELNLAKAWRENELKRTSDNDNTDNEEVQPKKDKRGKKKESEQQRKSKSKSSKSKIADETYSSRDTEPKPSSKKKGKASKKRKEKEMKSDHSETDTSSEESSKKKRKSTSESSSEESE